MLKNYLWEIYAIAEANKVDVGVGRDMLAANIDMGGPVEGQDWYEGAPNVPYAELHERWAVMSDAERAATKQEVADLIGEHYKALCAAWEAGDRQAFAAVLAEGV